MRTRLLPSLLFLPSLLVPLLLLGGFAVPASAAAPASPIHAVDADGHPAVLNARDVITAVLSSSPDTQDRTRKAGAILDPYRGRKDFRLIVVIDLRDSLAGIVPDFVKSQIRHNLDDESKRLVPFYRKNGNPGDPRRDAVAIPDFDGKLIDALAWNPDDDLLRVTVFGKEGRVLHYWEDLQKVDELYGIVTKALPLPLASDAKP